MNTVLLNTISLDDGRIIKKGGSGGGGGNTPGGGGGSDMPVIGDGKTYLYIKIAEKGRMNVPLYFSQTVANGVTIDWGDGSASQTLSGTGDKNTTHSYSDVGEYTITLNPTSGTLELGYDSSSYCVMGNITTTGLVYCNMLKAVEIGSKVQNIGRSTFKNCRSLESVVIPDNIKYIDREVFENCYSLSSVVILSDATSGLSENAFKSCYSLSSVVIPNGATSLGVGIFRDCVSLASVVIPDSVTSISQYAFYNCVSLASVVIPDSVTSIGGYAFGYCYGVAFYDFRASKSVPTLSGSYAFDGIPSDCKIVVPDSLYDEWIAATNWSSHVSKIVKASEFNA